MRGLALRIRPGHDRPRCAQPKTQLAKQPLTLPGAQTEPVLLLHVGRQGFAIPGVGGHAHRQRRATEHVADLLVVPLTKAGRTARPIVVDQAGQARRLELAHPIGHRPRSIAQIARHCAAAQALRHQQQSMQPMVIPRVPRPPNLVLKSFNDIGGFGNGEFLHASVTPQEIYMRNYLCRCV